MSFEYEKYLSVIKPLPASPTRLELTPRAGMSWEEVEHMRELKRRAEEFGRREMYVSKDLGLFRDPRDAINRSQAWELSAGIRDCGNDPNYP